jgi:hypothetical protein
MSRASDPGWDTALDAQTDLQHSFATVDGQKYLQGFTRSLGEAGVYNADTGEMVPGNVEDATRLVVGATQLLSNCEPMYVSDELTELIDFAAESFKPEPLLATDLLTGSGFAYFGAPLYVTDTRGLQMPFRAIQWNAQHQDGNVLIALYAHRSDGDPLDDGNHYSDMKIGGSDLTMEYVTLLRFGQESDVYATDRSVRDMLVHIKVFFRLCQQTIAVPRHERVARPTWKRARAEWKDIREVVVFTLRRAKNPKYEGEERDVQWSHRWIVQGHWRNQFYPSEKVHRQIGIAPFVKGPEGAPLIFKRRAFELVR